MTADLITTLLQFEEPSGAMSVDACGGLDDLYTPAGYTWPEKEIAVVGQAAVFDGAATVLQAQDLRLSGTLLVRDLTIATILRWNFDAQHAAGDVGTVISRGLDGSAAEYQAFGIELVVKDYAARTATVRMTWQDLGGTRRVDTGADFVPPPATEFILVSATRRWVTRALVVIDYYIGSTFLASSPAANGDIGGGVDGTTTIGARWTGAAFANFFAGALDELALANYVMAPEEIEALWLRLSDHQPDGYRMIREMLPPGLPITDNPDSEVQIDLRLIGAALGFASAQIENFRQNIMPDRAYGETLKRWEAITGRPARVGDAIASRRARVVGKIRTRAGVSIGGLEAALDELLDVDPGQLEYLAFDNTIRDSFAALEEELWNFSPLAAFTALNPDLRAQLAAGDYTWPGVGDAGAMALVSVDRPAGIQIFGLMTPTLLPANGETGVWLYSFARHHALFFGLRNVAGAYHVGYERFESGASVGGFVSLAVTALVPHWFRIRSTVAPGFLPGTGFADYDLSWSTIGSSDEADFTTHAALTWMAAFEWAGMYAKSDGVIATAIDVKFGDVAIRLGSGTRPYYWYVFRDPALGGTPDLAGAQAVARAMAHANTYTAVITSKSLLCDDDGSLTDAGPMGAL